MAAPTPSRRSGRTSKNPPEYATVVLRREPEVLTSNWLRVLTVPDEIYHVRPFGSLSEKRIGALAKVAPFPVLEHAGIVSPRVV